MIVGIGVDSIEIERVRKACESEAFLMRCFSEAEQQLFYTSKEHFLAEKAAGNWAVKEAVSKAFGTGFRTMSLTDIIVLRNELGKPFVELQKEARRISDELGITTIHATITNTKTEATAFVIAEGKEG